MKKYAVLSAGVFILAGLIINANLPCFTASSAFAQKSEAQAKVISKGTIVLGRAKTGTLGINTKHQYLLVVRSGASLSFEMQTKAEASLIPALEIQDSSKKTLEVSEPGQEGFSKTVRDMSPGRYYILATSTTNKAGQYSIKVERFVPDGP